jgi:addiction module RelE/StbE family toxin
MTYGIDIREKLADKLKKLKKANSTIHARIIKKINEIAVNPYIGKPLMHQSTEIRRVHIGHFVLTYEVDEVKHVITIIDFEHHDKAY